jgi:hypothetical protein
VRRFIAVLLLILPATCAADQAKKAQAPAAKHPTAGKGTDAPPPLPSDAAAEQRLLNDAGEGFRLSRTAHFVLAYDVPRPKLTHLLGRLEATYNKVRQFCRTAKIPLRVPPSKLEIIFVDRWSTYVRFARRTGIDPAGTYGFYDQLSNRTVFYNVEHDPQMKRLREQVERSKGNLDHVQKQLASLPPNVDRVELRYPDGRAALLSPAAAQHDLLVSRQELSHTERKMSEYSERLNQSVIQHEAAHHVLFAGRALVPLASNPQWLVEGLAMQFESPPTSSGHSTDSVSEYRLEEYRQAHKEVRLLPLPDVLWGPEKIGGSARNRATYYAQAWALVYYLKKKQPERLAAYVRALAIRRPDVPVAADQERVEFIRSFGPADEAFAKRLEKHILALPYRPSKVGF